jgi:hypothetical protein
MTNTITIKNTNLTENELIDIIEKKGGKVEVKEHKKKGRPTLYANKDDYIKMRNKMAKFKNMSLEKAKQQREKYIQLLNDLNNYIENEEREKLPKPTPMDVDPLRETPAN